jgi:hypothetical protein
MDAVLVMLSNGALIRTTDIPPDAIIVQEPPESEAPAQSVIDQTAAVTGRSDYQVTAPPKAKFDV